LIYSTAFLLPSVEVQLPFDEPDTRRSIISLQQMFRNYFAVNHFIGENQYETDNFGKQDAVERHVVVDLPPVLNINLRRRMYTANGGHSKVNLAAENFP
jgi:hypothetical protein